MSPWAPYLIAASAGLVFILGSAHLFLTFRGDKLHPRDAELTARLRDATLGITRETTVWKAWIGFNASHSLGAMFFGLVYGYLALRQRELLFESGFLLVLGFLLLGAYLVLAKAYWFSAPFRGIAVAWILYLSSIVLHWLL